MMHDLFTITDFEIVAPYTLRLTFDDGVIKTIDFAPMLRGELYAPLRDINFFNQVRLDEEVGTIVCPNDADFDPATLHDWDKVGQAMIALARTWSDSSPAVLNYATSALPGTARSLKESKENLNPEQ